LSQALSVGLVAVEAGAGAGDAGLLLDLVEGADARDEILGDGVALVGPWAQQQRRMMLASAAMVS
jgi:hypothetical protein